MRNPRGFCFPTRLRLSYPWQVRLNAQEKEALLRTIYLLSADHPARVASERGADPVVVMNLVERDELAAAMEEIWLAAYRRVLQVQAPDIRLERLGG